MWYVRDRKKKSYDTVSFCPEVTNSKRYMEDQAVSPQFHTDSDLPFFPPP